MVEKSPEGVKGTEKLHEYWERGPGAAKIMWGTPGDWKRCVAELSKYISDAPGYCTLMHHRVTGGWPGHAPGIEEAEFKAKHNKGKGK
jgi:hypothetical protein